MLREFTDRRWRVARRARGVTEGMGEASAPGPANTGDPGFRPGENTFSATPLAWTHAQFIRLARSIDAGTPVQTPRVVACRYVRSCG